MREGRASLTARVVALCRGLAPVPDPFMRRFVRGPGGAVLALAARSRPFRRAGRLASLGLVDHIALRTAAIDAAVEESDPPQLVLLGAGLDARAWRLSRREVFEVDHPSSQREKRSVAPAGPCFVPVDFARERFADALASAGHDDRRPTTWVWEGVTMYLPDAAVRDTLAQLASRSAPGSRLVMSYLAKDGVPRGAAGAVVELGFRALGEPLEARYAPEEIRDLLDAHGFEVRRDTTSRDWSRALGGDPRYAILVRGERLVVADAPGAR